MKIKPLLEAKHDLRTAFHDMYNSLHVAKDDKVRELHNNAHPDVVALKQQMEALDTAAAELRKAGVW